MKDTLRLGFAGTPDFAATILRGLLAEPTAGSTADSMAEIAHVVVVFTQPDRPTGRGRKLKPSPVKALATARQIPVRDPISLKQVSLAEFDLDVLIVAAYGLILPPHILIAPRLGCLNIHASLLPRWRGAAPVERAIMAGDRETGVCLMAMDEGLDTGPVYDCTTLRIEPTETGGQLEHRLAVAGTELLLRSLPTLATMTATPQRSTGITYAHKLTAESSQLDWHQDAEHIARQIQALADRQPVTVYCSEIDGSTPAVVRLRLLAASAVEKAAEGTDGMPGTLLSVDRNGLLIACASGCLRVEKIQLNRGKGTAMSAQAAANGFPDLLRPGRVLLTAPP